MLQALIVGHDSELGRMIGDHLENLGWSVFGTTRRTNQVNHNRFYLDASDPRSISIAANEFMECAKDWDLLVVAIGVLNPLGKISEVNFEQWRQSIEINFVSQVDVIQEMVGRVSKLPAKSRKVLTFAGSGTNSAPVNFSAYTLSKIALIKATEILAIEHPETIFLSLGTGWMRSPIHQQTLLAGELAGAAYSETKRRLEENEFGDPIQLKEFIDWYLAVNDSRISGRNIALQGDTWTDENFLDSLTSSDDSFKLRRSK